MRCSCNELNCMQVARNLLSRWGPSLNLNEFANMQHQQEEHQKEQEQLQEREKETQHPQHCQVRRNQHKVHSQSQLYTLTIYRQICSPVSGERTKHLNDNGSPKTRLRAHSYQFFFVAAAVDMINSLQYAAYMSDDINQQQDRQTRKKGKKQHGRWDRKEASKQGLQSEQVLATKQRLTSQSTSTWPKKTV